MWLEVLKVIFGKMDEKHASKLGFWLAAGYLLYYWDNGENFENCVGEYEVDGEEEEEEEEEEKEKEAVRYVKARYLLRGG